MTQLDNRKEPSQGPVGGSEAQEREAFEAWAHGDDAPYMRLHWTGSSYDDRQSSSAWQAWQAARATAAAPAAPVRVDGQTERLKNAALAVYTHRYQSGAPMLGIYDELNAAADAIAAHPPTAVVGQALEALTAMENFRDAVLNGRGPLEEPCLDNDQTNAVLAQFDDDCYEVMGALRAAVQAGEVPAVVDAPAQPLFYAFKHNRGNGKFGWTFHTPEEYLTAYRDTCLEIIPLAAMRATKEGN